MVIPDFSSVLGVDENHFRASQLVFKIDLSIAILNERFYRELVISVSIDPLLEK